MSCGPMSMVRIAWPGLTRRLVQLLAGLCWMAFWTDKDTWLYIASCEALSWFFFILWLESMTTDASFETAWKRPRPNKKQFWGAAAEAKAAGREGPDVLNGIAWDPDGKRIFVKDSDDSACLLLSKCAVVACGGWIALGPLKQTLPRSLESFGLQCSRFSSNQQENLHWKGPDGCAYHESTFSEPAKIGELWKKCLHSQSRLLAICRNHSCSRRILRILQH